MSETSPGTDLVLLPTTGELIPLDNPKKVAEALSTLKELRLKIREVEAELQYAMVAHSTLIGSKTIHLPGVRVTIKGGSETIYDPEAIMEGLNEAGMPEQRIGEIVIETVTYRVNAVEAKRAAAANPAYAAVIAQHTRVEEKRPTVEIK